MIETSHQRTRNKLFQFRSLHIGIAESMRYIVLRNGHGTVIPNFLAQKKKEKQKKQ